MTSVRNHGNGVTGPPPPLGAAVVVALRMLGDLDQVAAGVSDGRLEALLRTSLSHHVKTRQGQDGAVPDPAVAVLTACAHLAASGREDAYLALSTARDLLAQAAATGSAHEQPTDLSIDLAAGKLRGPTRDAASNRRHNGVRR
ncbi:hypothetical protein [Actinomycetospora flava]|uniref:Uncharacterized protein n=1 Tax=Actinomycetospora flava TaxID=3129232 RepID=A0ABU8MBG9_9PSEU